MRTAFVIDRFRPGKGGLERWLAAFGLHLAKPGHELSLLSRDAPLQVPSFSHHSLRTRGPGRARRDRGFAERARDFCRERGFDVVVGLRVCLACDVYYPHGGSVPATFAARRRATPIVSPRVRNFLAIERELLEGPSPPRRVVAVSRMVERDLAERYPGIADRIAVVPNGVDLSRFTPEGRDRARAELAPGGGGTVAFLAGNPKLKGWSAARRAFLRLRASGAAERMLVAGGRPRGLPPGARYLGRTDRPEEVLRAADLLLYPTLYDPFPLITLESLACGTPVVTTEQNGALDHLGRDGPVRAVARPEDVKAIVQAAEELLSDPPRAAARRLAEGFPLEESLARAARILEEASGWSSGGPPAP